MKKEIELVRAGIEDAELIHQMKYESFLPLYEKYHDDETSPVKEDPDSVIRKIQQDWTDYYMIRFKGENAGAVRIRKQLKGNQAVEDVRYISPIFLLPRFQNQGIGYCVLQEIFKKYNEVITWKLDTIKQEQGNCHLYEKCGFVRTGEEKPVNEFMTLIDYEKVNVSVRKYKDSDAEEIADLLIRNFREVNSRDYSGEEIDEMVRTHDAEWVRQIAGYAHMYVFCRKEEIVAVGSISSFWGSETESILLTVFVMPKLHGKGIGRMIIRTLENDELFIRADRIEIPASITGVEFYRKLGYDYKNGIKELDGEGHYRLEKFRR